MIELSKRAVTTHFRAMPDLTDLRTICSALEHFSLPAGLGNLNNDFLVFWNQAFQERAGVSDIELAQARLTALILLDESYSGLALQHHDSEHMIIVHKLLLSGCTSRAIPQ